MGIMPSGMTPRKEAHMAEEISYVWRVVKKALTCDEPVFNKEMTGSIEDMKAVIARHMWFQVSMDDELFKKGTVRPDDVTVAYNDSRPVVSGYADFAGFGLTMKAESLRQADESDLKEEDSDEK